MVHMRPAHTQTCFIRVVVFRTNTKIFVFILRVILMRQGRSNLFFN